MTSINQGISGGFSGKVGTVVGGNWNGIDYMRSNGTGRKDAKSSTQLDQRVRFLTVLQFLSPLKEFLHVGFKNRVNGITAYNAATAYHLEHALTGSFPDYRIDYSRVRVSQGKLPGVLNPMAVSVSPAKIRFTWDNNSSAIGAMADDRAVVVIYNPSRKSVQSFMGSSTRLSGNQSVQLPVSYFGDEVHCYMTFQNASQTVISGSRFVRSLIVL